MSNVSPQVVRDQLDSIFSTNYRENVLNSRIHFLLLDARFLKETLLKNLTVGLRALDAKLDPLEYKFIDKKGDIKTPTTSPEFLAAIKSDAIRDLTDLSDAISKFVLLKHNTNQVTIEDILSGKVVPTAAAPNVPSNLPMAVKDGTDVIGVFYPSFSSAQSGIFKDFLNKHLTKLLSDVEYEKRIQEKLSKTKPDLSPTVKKGYDLGHLISSGLGEEESIISPAIYKINALIDAVTKTISELETSQSGSPKLQKLKDMLSGIRGQKSDLLGQSRYGTYAITFLKDFTYSGGTRSGNLLAVTQKVRAVVVFPQDAIENQYLFGNKVEGSILDKVKKLFGWINFSRNVMEEIPYVVVSILEGKVPKNTSAKVPLTGKFKRVKRSTITSSTPKSGNSNKRIKSSPIRTQQGRFTSLANLQSLLNLALAQQIQRNMGTGTSKNILNYRSGRLAESAEVTRMSQSREGMITAFYTYMRNPYGTFSEGGAQSNPPSRDPKLLISKSIREVLATQVNNRLRAVLA